MHAEPAIQTEYGSNAIARDATPLEGAMNALRVEISALDEQLGILNAQLSPLKREHPERAELRGDTVPRAARSAHVYDVEEQVARLHTLLERVQEIRDCLDL